jgi:glycosyltransferase involved in cell wall biosynthesis
MELIVVEDLAGAASLGRGGLAMYVLQWLHGLERAGHEVFYVEFLKEPTPEAAARAARYFRRFVGEGWHPERASLLLEPSQKSLCGPGAAEVARVAGRAGALVTLAAHYRREPYPLVDKIRPRILVEQDPGYTHLWAAGGDPADVFGEHDLYFTVGGNVGSPRCRLPTLGMTWRPTWNPVVLDWWAPRPTTRDRFTTVADWRGYGYLEFEGQVLGPKAEEFRKFIDLPVLAGEPLEIALCIDPDDPDLAYLRQHGWRVESPEVASTPGAYREYVAGSLGEFSCVKGGYAGTHCGWFSDRSACYLAAGRPVVLQATGFADLLPTGRGLFSVSTPEEAAEAIEAIRKDYSLHASAARKLAREHLDAARVAGKLLAEAGIGGPSP